MNQAKTQVHPKLNYIICFVNELFNLLILAYLFIYLMEYSFLFMRI